MTRVASRSGDAQHVFRETLILCVGVVSVGAAAALFLADNPLIVVGTWFVLLMGILCGLLLAVSSEALPGETWPDRERRAPWRFLAVAGSASALAILAAAAQVPTLAVVLAGLAGLLTICGYFAAWRSHRGLVRPD